MVTDLETDLILSARRAAKPTLPQPVAKADYLADSAVVKSTENITQPEHRSRHDYY